MVMFGLHEEKSPRRANRQLHARVVKISNDGLRRSFWENVFSYQDLVRLNNENGG
jgi:hypothetical protein